MSRTMTSSSPPATPLSRARSFSLLLHLASLALLIVCVYCIVVLFRDLRQLEALVKEKTILIGAVGNGAEGRSSSSSSLFGNAEGARFRRRSQHADAEEDLYGYADEEAAGGRRDEEDPSVERSYGKRTAPADQRVNLSGSKLTIVTKDDEKLLLQTSDGSPWVMLPSMTRISLSTLEDFCLTTHQYCASKNQAVRPFPGRQGSPGSNRRSNSEIPRDTESRRMPPTTGDGGQEESARIQQYAPRTVGSTGSPSIRDNELLSNQIYDGESSIAGQPSSSSTTALDENSPSANRRKGLGRKKRKRERCFIEHIGSPPFKMGGERRVAHHGSWMQDSSPRDDFDVDKRWVTEHVEGSLLFEYASPADLRRGGLQGNAPDKILPLDTMFDGTNHVMYNGSFIYKRLGAPTVVRYDLRTNNSTEIKISGAAYNNADYLYNENSMVYFDFAVDENGLWVFFHYEKRKALSVARLHPKTMRMIKVWNLTRFDHTQIGDTWVACGVMYVLDSRKEHDTKVSVAYDLFRHRSATVNMPWRNTYNQTTMVTYNPRARRLHIYDNGYLLERNLLMAFPGRQSGII